MVDLSKLSSVPASSHTIERGGSSGFVTVDKTGSPIRSATEEKLSVDQSIEISRDHQEPRPFVVISYPHIKPDGSPLFKQSKLFVEEKIVNSREKDFLKSVTANARTGLTTEVINTLSAKQQEVLRAFLTHNNELVDSRSITIRLPLFVITTVERLAEEKTLDRPFLSHESFQQPILDMVIQLGTTSEDTTVRVQLGTSTEINASVDEKVYALSDLIADISQLHTDLQSRVDTYNASHTGQSISVKSVDMTEAIKMAEFFSKVPALPQSSVKKYPQQDKPTNLTTSTLAVASQESDNADHNQRVVEFPIIDLSKSDAAEQTEASDASSTNASDNASPPVEQTLTKPVVSSTQTDVPEGTQTLPDSEKIAQVRKTITVLQAQASTEPTATLQPEVSIVDQIREFVRASATRLNGINEVATAYQKWKDIPNLVEALTNGLSEKLQGKVDVKNLLETYLRWFADSSHFVSPLQQILKKALNDPDYLDALATYAQWENCTQVNAAHFISIYIQTRKLNKKYAEKALRGVQAVLEAGDPDAAIKSLDNSTRSVLIIRNIISAAYIPISTHRTDN